MRRVLGRVGLAVVAVATLAAGADASVQGPGHVLRINPESPPYGGNCIPFGDNVDYGFTGFIYRDVPAFTLVEGRTIGFDLVSLNNVRTKRNIYLSAANKNPDPAEVEGGNVISQGVAAVQWVKVVPEGQTPQNAYGDTVFGNYELRFRSTADFVFEGGGLILGVGGSPPGNYEDPGCEASLSLTGSSDASGNFYARYCYKDHLTSDILDEAGGCSGTADNIGGISMDVAG